MEYAKVYLRHIEGKGILPCLEDGTILAGIERINATFAMDNLTTIKIDLYPAGIIQNDGTVDTKTFHPFPKSE